MHAGTPLSQTQSVQAAGLEYPFVLIAEHFSEGEGVFADHPSSEYLGVVLFVSLVYTTELCHAVRRTITPCYPRLNPSNDDNVNKCPLCFPPGWSLATSTRVLKLSLTQTILGLALRFRSCDTKAATVINWGKVRKPSSGSGQSSLGVWRNSKKKLHGDRLQRKANSANNPGTTTHLCARHIGYMGRACGLWQWWHICGGGDIYTGMRGKIHQEKLKVGSARSLLSESSFH